jgi:hypothetical protein
LFKKQTFIIWFLVLLNIASFHFFKPAAVDIKLLKLIHYLFLGVAGVISLNYFLTTHKSSYENILKCFVFSLGISILSAYVFWNQSIIDTTISHLPYLDVFIFFFLCSQNVRVAAVEKAIWIFCVIYLVFYFYAFINAPTVIFEGYGSEIIDTSRGGLPRIRLTLIGAGPLYLGFFLALSRFKEKDNWMWLCVAVLLFVIIIMHLGRQAIFFGSVLGVFLLVYKLPFKKKLFSIVCVAIFSWAVLFNNPLIVELYERTHSQYERHLDKGDIRFNAYQFYLFDVSSHWFQIVFGNGRYVYDKGSSYGDFIRLNGSLRGYIPADVGYAQIYLMFGLFGITLFVWLFIRVWLQKIPQRFIYLKIYIFFLALCSIAGSAILGSLPTFCMALYALEKLESNSAKETSTIRPN